MGALIGPWYIKQNEGGKNKDKSLSLSLSLMCVSCQMMMRLDSAENRTTTMREISSRPKFLPFYYYFPRLLLTTKTTLFSQQGTESTGIILSFLVINEYEIIKEVAPDAPL
jgi:hypothetical protein